MGMRWKLGNVCGGARDGRWQIDLKQTELHLLRVDLAGAFVKTRAGLIGCYDGLEVVAFPPFLLSIAIGSQRGCGCNFLGLRSDGFLDVGAIHHRESSGVGGNKRGRLLRGLRGLPLNLGSRFRRNDVDGWPFAQLQLICSDCASRRRCR